MIIIKSKKLKGKDILLLFLYLPGTGEEKNEKIYGRTRLTKMMFLFEKELYKKFDNLDENSLPNFFAYDYGPFSKELLDDLRFFKMINFITEDNTKNKLSKPELEEYLYDINDDIGYGDEIDIFDVDIPNEVAYQLTEKGINYVEDKLLDKLSEKQKQILQRFKEKINKLSLDAILEYVYKKYPDSAENSLIKERYLKQE